jgi:hypothetical protein
VLTTFKIVHVGPVVLENVTAEMEGISQGIVGVIMMALGLLGLYGRLTAKKEIKI